MSQAIRITSGVLIWCSLVGLLVVAWGNQRTSHLQRVAKDLANHATGRQQRVFVTMEQKMPLGVGDPVFVRQPDGSYLQVGEVRSIPAQTELSFGTSDWVQTGELLLYSQAPHLSPQAQLTLHETPQSMEWVLQTMLPPEKRREVAEEISHSLEQHQEDIVRSLRPVIEAGFRDALSVVEVDLEAALAARSDELERIGAKYQTDLVQREIVPLVRAEIFPIVKYYAAPLATRVGKQMWDEASLWRFGWRYMYDISPLPQRDLARREWDRFLEQDATPILEEHIDDFVEVQQDIFRDVARNPEVQDVIRSSLRKIIRDPEVQQLVVEIVREVLIDNPRLQEVLRRHWQSPAAKQAFQIASQRLEPTVTRIGEMLFGNPESGITPEFTRVLRNRVLRKDARWLLLTPASDLDEDAPERGELPRSSDAARSAEKASSQQVVLPLEWGETRTENPFAFPEGKRPAPFRSSDDAAWTPAAPRSLPLNETLGEPVS